MITWVPFATPAVAVVLAAGEGQPLAVWGPLGVCLAAVAWFMRELILRVIQDKDRAVASHEKLVDMMMTKAIPAIEKSADALLKAIPAIDKSTEAMNHQQELNSQLVLIMSDVRRQLGQVT